MKIKVSPFVIVAAAILAFTGRIYLFISFAAALTVHELAHASKAQKCGYALKEVKIGIFGAEMTGDAAIPVGDRVRIAAAGPVASLVTALIFTGLWWTFPELYFFTRDFAAANFSLAVFNALPAHPLDGSVIVAAALQKTRLNGEKAVKIFSAVLSALLVAAYFAVFPGGNATLIVAAASLFICAVKPGGVSGVFARLYDRAIRYEKFCRGMPSKTFIVSVECPVGRIKKLMSPQYYSFFLVADTGTLLYESDFDFTGKKQDKLPLGRSDIYLKRKKAANMPFFS